MGRKRRSEPWHGKRWTQVRKVSATATTIAGHTAQKKYIKYQATVPNPKPFEKWERDPTVWQDDSTRKAKRRITALVGEIDEDILNMSLPLPADLLAAVPTDLGVCVFS